MCRRNYTILTCVAGLLIVAAALWQFVQIGERAKFGGGSFHLRATLEAWDRFGRPEGQELLEFMKKVASDVVVTNRIFTIKGQIYATKFATARLGTPGTLFITTNGTLVLVQKDRDPRVLLEHNN